jgi:hypothetical protein
MEANLISSISWITRFQIYKGKPEFSSSNADCNFLGHMDNSMCHNGSDVVSKFDRHHIARLAHLPYSPDLSPYNFWLFGMLTEILKDREFHSPDEIEEAITMAWNHLTFDGVQSVFHNWMN